MASTPPTIPIPLPAIPPFIAPPMAFTATSFRFNFLSKIICVASENIPAVAAPIKDPAIIVGNSQL